MGKIIKTYTEEEIVKACYLVKTKKVKSIKNAAKMFNIPYSTLHDRLRFAAGFENVRLGTKPILTSLEEQELVTWITTCNMRGLPVDRQLIRLGAKLLLDLNHRNTKFINNLPGKNWLFVFIKKHPNLTLCKREVSTEDASESFSVLQERVNSLIEMLPKPTHSNINEIDQEYKAKPIKQNKILSTLAEKSRCRCCYSSKNLVPFTSYLEPSIDSTSSKTVCECFQEITMMNLSRLEKEIAVLCKLCLKELKIAYNFKTKTLLASCLFNCPNSKS